MDPGYSENDYLKRRAPSKEVENAIGEMLKILGFNVTVSDAESPARAELDQKTLKKFRETEKDIIVHGLNGKDLVLEVKGCWTQKFYDSPSTFPFRTVNIERVDKYEAKLEKPFMYLRVSCYRQNGVMQIRGRIAIPTFRIHKDAWNIEDIPDWERSGVTDPCYTVARDQCVSWDDMILELRCAAGFASD